VQLLIANHRLREVCRIVVPVKSLGQTALAGGDAAADNRFHSKSLSGLRVMDLQHP
jgi:hypothetical protein